MLTSGHGGHEHLLRDVTVSQTLRRSQGPSAIPATIPTARTNLLVPFCFRCTVVACMTADPYLMPHPPFIVTAFLVWQSKRGLLSSSTASCEFIRLLKDTCLHTCQSCAVRANYSLASSHIHSAPDNTSSSACMLFTSHFENMGSLHHHGTVWTPSVNKINKGTTAMLKGLGNTVRRAPSDSCRECRVKFHCCSR